MDGDRSEELSAKDVLALLDRTVTKTYWDWFNANLGSHCHAFLEFNGLLREYVKMCRSALADGVDFRHANGHGEQSLPMTVFQAEYLAEKLECIFGESLRCNPEVADAFKRKLGI